MAITSGFESKSSGSEKPPESLECPKCKVKFTNIHDLLTHQGSAQHFACPHCDLCFWSEHGLLNHKRKNHRPDQVLECFGCHTRFGPAGEFWRHLELSQCPAIFPSDIARLRDKKLEFAEQLELRKGPFDDIIHDRETHLKEETRGPRVDEETTPNEPIAAPNSSFIPAPTMLYSGSAHRLHYRSQDFPPLPTKKSTPSGRSMHGEREKKECIWADFKAVSQTPNVSRTNNAVPPASQQHQPADAAHSTFQKPGINDKIQVRQAPVKSAQAQAGVYTTTSSSQIIDPDHPDYNPAIFYNQLLEMYVCPYKICLKKFPNAPAISRHLRSPTHAGGRYPCIGCSKIFATVSSLISHMESASRRCPVRDSDNFRPALGQLTGGILDFDMRSDIFVVDMKSVQELLRLRSEAKATPEEVETKVVHADTHTDTHTDVPVIDDDAANEWYNPDYHW
ncbi:hypothetical protein GGS21DRAFT_3032 [Xylaria nigripes]|nr:hypothetical protein GGS21DRAFT_3032 [Xylaria nigripes]